MCMYRRPHYGLHHAFVHCVPVQQRLIMESGGARDATRRPAYYNTRVRRRRRATHAGAESLAESEPRRQAHNGMADDAEDSESVLGRIQDQACVCHTRCT